MINAVRNLRGNTLRLLTTFALLATQLVVLAPTAHAAADFTAWANPWYLGTGYAAPQPVSLTRDDGGTFAAETTVALHERDLDTWGVGPEVADAVANVQVDAADASVLTLDLVQTVAPGYYVLVSTSGVETGESDLEVGDPRLDVMPWAVDEASTLPVALSATGYATTWDGTTTLQLFTWTGEGVGDEIVGALGSPTVTAPTELTFELTSMPAQGEYVVRSTTGTDVADGFLTITTPGAVLEPAAFAVGYTDAFVTSYGTLTTWDGTTTLAIHPVDEAGTAGAAIDGAATLDAVHGADYAELTLLAGLAAGSYVARFTTGSDVIDAPFEVAAPSITLSPPSIASDHWAPVDVWVTGQFIDFTAAAPTVELLDGSGAVVEDASSSATVFGPSDLSFQLGTVPAQGLYTVRVAVDAAVAEAPFEVTGPAPYGFMEPFRFDVGYATPQTVTVTGEHTSFADGVTTVEIRTQEGGPTDAIVENLVVTSATQLSFDVAGPTLPEGGYVVAVTTADEEILIWFEVSRLATAQPNYLEGGYATPLPVTIDGSGTAWDETTTVVLRDPSADVTLTAAIADVVVDPSTQQVSLDVVESLAPAFYVFVIDTGGVVEEAFFEVYPPEPVASMTPFRLPTGHAVPAHIVVDGVHTSWATGVTTVAVEDPSGGPVEATIENLTVTSPTSLEFDLASQLPEGFYALAISTESQVVRTWFGVDRVSAATPNVLDETHQTPLDVTLQGSGTSWDDTTTVVLRDPFADVTLTDAIAGTTLDASAQTFSLQLVTTLEPGFYVFVTDTGGVVEEAFLEVYAGEFRAWASPEVLPVDYAARTIELTGSSTWWGQGSTAVELLDASGTTVRTYGVDDVEVTGSLSLTFPLAAGLPAGSYTLRVTTEGPTVEGDLHVVAPAAQLSSPNGSTTVNPDGTVTISIPEALSSDVTVTRDIACTGDDVIVGAVLEHGGASYTMAPVAEGSPEWVATIPADDLVSGPITVVVTCDDGQPSGTSQQSWSGGDGVRSTSAIYTDEQIVGQVVRYQPIGTVEAGLNAPIEGATVRLHRVPTWQPKTDATDDRPDTCQSTASKASGETWNQLAPTDLGVVVAAGSSAISPNVNPQVTNAAGTFGWGLDVGCWYVEVSRVGYAPRVSPVFGVAEAGAPVDGLRLVLKRVADDTAPAWATDSALSSSELTATSVRLTWPAATDAIGVAGYRVLRGTDVVGTTGPDARSLTVAGLSPSTTYELSVVAFDTADNVSAPLATSVTTLARPAGVPPTSRAAGDDRFATSVALSQRYAPGVDVVFIAHGRNYADALAGGPAASVDGAPVLLVEQDEIPAVVADELERLAPGKIVILGGEAAVSSGVEEALAAFTTGAVERIGGTDRFDTAAKISARWFDTAATVYVVTGRNFPDALAAGAAAARDGAPVLLTERDELPAVTAAELKRLAPTRIVLVGGVNAVSLDVEAALADIATTDRVDGDTRYDTAADVAAGYPAPANVVYVATGENYPDALAAISAAGQDGAPLVLVRHDAIPASSAAQLERLTPGRIVILGGEAAVSAEVATQLEGYTAG